MIRELHEKLRNKETTAVELAEQSFDKIEKDNKRLNVFLDIYKEEALEKAKQVDKKIEQGAEIGLLEGLPCAIKDNICMKDKRTTAGSKILEKYIAPYDANVIEKLDAENPIYLGKTNLDEFAMGSSTENSAFGVTKNPYEESRVPGGSSGGSAAAVASDMAVWALGSDTGGSIRQPAALCGVTGLKTTYGRVSRYGLLAMASSYDQIGPITKNVEDCAMVLDAIYGKDSRDNTTIEKKEAFLNNLKPEIKGKKIGILEEFLNEGLDGRIKKAIEEKIDWAKSQGAEIVEIEMPNIKYSLAVYYIMVPSEVSSNLARFDGIKYGFSEALLENSKSRDILDVYYYSRELGFGPETKRRIILGTYALSAGYYDAYYKKAQKVRELIKTDFKKAFEKVDAIMTPTSPTPAFKIGEKIDDPIAMYLSDIYTVPANVAMAPAISIPTGFVEEEGKQLPIGLQLIGKWWDEQGILNLAKAIEEGAN